MVLEQERRGDVLVATWRDTENRLNLDSIAALEALVEQVSAIDGPIALVIAGDGKFFSNGLDLERFGANPDEFGRTVEQFHLLLGRLYVLNAYTVAVINGHAFAGGAMLSCAFDYRIMREDRGYWCLNEAEIGLPLTGPMASAVLGRLPRATALDAMLTARRFSGPDAFEAGIVDALGAADQLIELAVARATLAATKDRTVVATHKRLVHTETARACGWTS